MTSLFFLDVPENRPVIEVGSHAPGVNVRRIGPYVELQADFDIVIDRRATGTRHAVWYSAIAGIHAARIVQHDSDCLRVEPA